MFLACFDIHFLTRFQVLLLSFLSSPLSLALPCLAAHTTHHTRTDTPRNTHRMDGFDIDENSAVLGSDFCWIVWFSSVWRQPRAGRQGKVSRNSRGGW